MTIQEAVEKLRKEKLGGVKARFHCRAIMVDTIEQYARLLKELKKLGDTDVVPLDELFSGADVMPGYEVLTGREYQDKWLILPGVSEYLRLFHASEETAQRFGSLWHFQSDAQTVGRILIPLWGCDTLWYDSALGLCEDERQTEYVLNCSEAGECQQMNIQVLSGEFEQHMAELQSNRGYVSYGLKEWYRFWYEPRPDVVDHLILTRRFKSIRPTDGEIRIHVVRDALSFIRENMPGGAALDADICPRAAQECLFSAALNGEAVAPAILAALNVHAFQPLDIMGRWATLSEGQRQLVFLWYALHPDDSYLGFCVGLSKNIGELTGHILTAIFPVRGVHPGWVGESQSLIAAVPIARSDEYFAQLDEMDSPEECLNYLTDSTARERVYILRLAGQWLRDDPEAALQSRSLQKVYPALAAYLADGYPDEALDRYFGKYKAYKLSNTLPVDEETYFAELDTDAYENRYPVLSDEANGEGTFVLWIDALGIEWLPLLEWALRSSGEGTLTSVKVTRALLPSETRFNELWKQLDLPYEKYDRLDKLAHKGAIDEKDYYACVEEQFSFVAGIAQTVDRLLKRYSRVLITGDHGTSRLAARFFHKREALPLPPGAVAGSHGRFCRIDGQAPAMATQKTAKDTDGNRYLVFFNYDHYPQPGFAAGADDDAPIYGEVHGGASPEEVLVPVFTVQSRNELPLKARWGMEGNAVRISGRQAKCSLQFSRPVREVQLRMGELNAECSAATRPSRDWTATFAGIRIDRPTRFEVSLLADGTLVNVEPVEIIPALGSDDPF